MKFTTTLYGGLLACAFGAASLHAADDLFEDKVIVRGDGFEITQNELDKTLEQRKAQLAAAGRSIPEGIRDQVEKEMLDVLILKEVLLTKATAADKEAASVAIDQQLAMAPEGELARQARLLGVSVEELTAELNEQAVAKQVVDRELEPKAMASTEAARAFYEENPAEFEAPERVRAAHVLLSTQTEGGTELSETEKAEKLALAKEIVEKARNGDDFAALAKEYSDDPGSKDNGGEYTFPRGQMVKPFEDSAFSMAPGEVSDVVTTQYGYHVIKVLEKLPADMRKFEEVEANIKDFLTRQELQKLIQAYIKEIKQDPKLEILAEKYKG